MPCVQRLVNDANSTVLSWKKNLKNICIVFIIIDQLFQQIMMLQTTRNIHLLICRKNVYVEKILEGNILKYMGLIYGGILGDF